MEADRKCVFCGRAQRMMGFICASCQDKIQREALKRNLDIKKQAEETLRKHGIESGN